VSVLNGVGELAVVERRDVPCGRTCQSRVKASSKSIVHSYERERLKYCILTLQHLRATDLAETHTLAPFPKITHFQVLGFLSKLNVLFGSSPVISAAKNRQHCLIG
jgi:hypothetical protein